MSEKLSGNPETPMIDNMTIPAAFKQIAPFEGNRKAWFHQISRKTGLTPRKVKGLYYGESQRLWAAELDAIHRAISAHHKEAVRLLERQGELSNETVNELKHLFSEFLEAYRRPDSH